MQNEEDISNAEEWQEIQKKFDTEGINFNIPSRKKVLYLWRWLGDSENNLGTSRKMLDKLRMQQAEEMKEVEKFVEHIKHISSAAIDQLENENKSLKQSQEELRSKSIEKVSQEVSEMLSREGLNEIINSNLAEQVAYLLVLRTRLTEELELERNKMVTSANLTDNLKLTSTQFQQMLEEQKSDFEEELRHERELTKQLKEELRKTHDVEIAQLQLKLTAAQKRVDELENRVCTQNNSYSSAKDDDANKDEKEVLEINKLREKLTLMEERLKKLEYTKRQLENDNESLSYKVSELLIECEEKEAQLRRERMKKIGAKPFSRESSTSVSPKRFRNNLDNKINSQQEQPFTQQIKRLQQDVENLQDQLLSVGGRHDALALRYQQRKADGRTKMQKIRGVFQAKQTSFKDQITELESSLNVLRTSLSWEKECRQKIQTDFASLQNEKQDLMKRFFVSEEQLKEKSIQLKSLNSRVDHLETENSRVGQEMALLKKLVLQEVLGSSSQKQQHKETKKKSSSSWLKKMSVISSHENNNLAILERMLIPANEDQKEITV